MKNNTDGISTITTAPERIPTGTFYGEFHCTTCHRHYFEKLSVQADCRHCGAGLELHRTQFIETTTTNVDH